MPPRNFAHSTNGEVNLKYRIALSAAALALSAGTASAQKPAGVELGVDATAQIGLGDHSYTTFDIPSGVVRAGFPMNNRVSIEPRGSLYISSGNGDTYTSYDLELGALYHLDVAAKMRQGVYVRPALGVYGATGDGSYNTVFGGVGVGYKKPLFGQLGTRYEAAFYHDFNNGSSNGLAFSAGLSWFTK
jgi:hypothetical protein